MDTTTARTDGNGGYVIERDGKPVGRAAAGEDLAVKLRETGASEQATAAVVRTLKRGPGGVATPD